MVWKEKTKYIINNQPINRPVRSLDDKDVEPSRPDEIIEAKMDGICPRCEGVLEQDEDGGWCKCGFTW